MPVLKKFRAALSSSSNLKSPVARWEISELLLTNFVPLAKYSSPPVPRLKERLNREERSVPLESVILNVNVVGSKYTL